MLRQAQARSWWPLTLVSWATGTLLLALTLVGVHGVLREDTYARCAALFPDFIHFEDTSALVDARASLWPLGLRCTFHPTDTAPVTLTSGWFLTGLALGAVAIALISVVWRLSVATTTIQRIASWVPVILVLVFGAYLYSSISPALLPAAFDRTGAHSLHGSETSTRNLSDR